MNTFIRQKRQNDRQKTEYIQHTQHATIFLIISSKRVFSCTACATNAAAKCLYRLYTGATKAGYFITQLSPFEKAAQLYEKRK